MNGILDQLLATEAEQRQQRDAEFLELVRIYHTLDAPAITAALVRCGRTPADLKTAAEVQAAADRASAGLRREQLAGERRELREKIEHWRGCAREYRGRAEQARMRGDRGAAAENNDLIDRAERCDTQVKEWQQQLAEMDREFATL